MPYKESPESENVAPDYPNKKKSTLLSEYLSGACSVVHHVSTWLTAECKDAGTTKERQADQTGTLELVEDSQLVIYLNESR